MRRITLIVIHCSAVRPGQQSSARDIDCWHRQRGWREIGYHYVIRRDGSIEPGRRLEQVGAHCKGHNQHSIGICYEGGLDDEGRPADTRTEQQKNAMKDLVAQLHAHYPQALIVGHHDLDPRKACPCFDVVKAFQELEP